MPARQRSRPATAVGIDLGGTWVRALALALDGRRLRSFRGRAPDLEGLPQFLRSLWRRWDLAPARVAGLVVASRGVWTASETRRQERRLRSLAPKVQVLADVKAAYLGALGDAPGLLVLAGTGSIVLGRGPGGRWLRRGGLGPLLGDEGSAFWIGREWLKRAARRDDLAALRRLARAPNAPARIAAVAAKVLRRARSGDRFARRIVAEAQQQLVRQAAEAARALGLSPPIRVSWAGGLLEDSTFRAGLWWAMRRSGLSVRPTPPQATPVFAATRFALTLARRGSPPEFLA